MTGSSGHWPVDESIDRNTDHSDRVTWRKLVSRHLRSGGSDTYHCRSMQEQSEGRGSREE